MTSTSERQRNPPPMGKLCHRFYAGAMDKLYLDDLEVGQRFVSGTHTLGAVDMIRFAAEYDPQPFHLDDAAARETLFGGLVASGWHTAVNKVYDTGEAGRQGVARATSFAAFPFH